MSYSFRSYTSNETCKEVGDQQLTPDVTVSWGGGTFLPNFQESLFLALNYTLGTNFVPNVLKKVLFSYSDNEI